MQKSNLHPVMEYGIHQSAAIGCLREKGFMQATLVLLFAQIDQLAWLVDEKEKIGGNGFKAWVQKYLLDRNSALLSGATAADLWGARCGILHTGAPESDDFRKGDAKKIHYSYGYVQVPTTDPDVLELSLEGLANALAAGILFFLDDLESDTAKDERVRAKLGRRLVEQPF